MAARGGADGRFAGAFATRFAGAFATRFAGAFATRLAGAFATRLAGAFAARFAGALGTGFARRFVTAADFARGGFAAAERDGLGAARRTPAAFRAADLGVRRAGMEGTVSGCSRVRFEDADAVRAVARLNGRGALTLARCETALQWA
jgi:hypothetical protein